MCIYLFILKEREKNNSEKENDFCSCTWSCFQLLRVNKSVNSWLSVIRKWAGAAGVHVLCSLFQHTLSGFDFLRLHQTSFRCWQEKYSFFVRNQFLFVQNHPVLVSVLSDCDPNEASSLRLFPGVILICKAVWRLCCVCDWWQKVWKWIACGPWNASQVDDWLK